MRIQGALIITLCCAALAGALSGCERERRRFRESPPSVPTDTPRQSSLQPGTPTGGARGHQPSDQPLAGYQENAYAISEGKRQYEWFNCKGCHAEGGGDIGPPLMDAQWIYGGSPQEIYTTIVEGRPNGMPAFGGKISARQVWQIVAYVRSLSGNVPDDAAPGRNDHMQTKKPELRKEEEPVVPRP